MNPAGAEGTALWGGSESLHPAQTPSLLDKSNTEAGQEEWGNCTWICHSPAHGMIITTVPHEEGLGRCSQHPSSCSQLVLQRD